MSYSDRQRIRNLEREKSIVMSDMDRSHMSIGERIALKEKLRSIDREISAIRGVPMVIQDSHQRANNPGIANSQPMPSATGGILNPVAGGYVSPNGEFCSSVAGGAACPSGFVPLP